MYPFKKWIDHATDQSGNVMVQGTPQSATNFNNIEDGITDAHAATSVFLQWLKLFVTWIEAECAKFRAEFLNEVRTVTLSNSLKYPFNNSQQTVSMATARNTLNYDVAVEVTSATGGEVGDIAVTDKQLNGFKLAYSGSATSVAFKIRIKGGMLV